MKKNGKIVVRKTKKTVDEVSRLMENLKQAEGFSLHVCFYDNEQLNKSIVKEIKESKLFPLKYISLKKKPEPIAHLLEKISKSKPKDCFCISGLDKAVMPDDETFNFEILEKLNLELAKPEQFNCPMVFLFPISFVEFLKEDLPKMWENRQGLYVVEKQDKDPFRVAYFLSDHFSESTNANTYFQKKNLLELYQDLQLEYQEETEEEYLLLKYNAIGKTVCLLYRLGDYQGTRQLLRKQMDLAMALGNDKYFPEILNNLGMLYQTEGRFRKALEQFKQAFQITQKKLRGSNHPAKIVLVGNISNVECSLGDIKEAYLLGRNALRMGERKLGMRHVQLLPILIKCARIARKRELYEDALDDYRRALHIVEAKLELDHPYIADILQNIGMTYFGQKKYEIAQRYVYRTLERFEKSLGPEHPYLGLLLKNIGLTHFYCHDPERALKYYLWALDVRAKGVGREDLMVGTIYSHIGQLYQTQGKNFDAQICYEKALQICKNKLPSKHQDIQLLESQLKAVEHTHETEETNV